MKKSCFILLFCFAACAHHPKDGAIVTMKGKYNGKMFSYFIPDDFPKEKWSLAGDTPDLKFSSMYARLFQTHHDSLMTLHKPQYDYQLEVYGMWVDVTVKGKLEGGKYQYCKHEDCRWQLTIQDVIQMKPLGYEPKTD